MQSNSLVSPVFSNLGPDITRNIFEFIPGDQRKIYRLVNNFLGQLISAEDFELHLKIGIDHLFRTLSTITSLQASHRFAGESLSLLPTPGDASLEQSITNPLYTLIHSDRDATNFAVVHQVIIHSATFELAREKFAQSIAADLTHYDSAAHRLEYRHAYQNNIFFGGLINFMSLLSISYSASVVMDSAMKLQDHSAKKIICLLFITILLGNFFHWVADSLLNTSQSLREELEKSDRRNNLIPQQKLLHLYDTKPRAQVVKQDIIEKAVSGNPLVNGFNGVNRIMRQRYSS